MSEKKGKLVIFAAPSGAGKSSLVNYLLPKFPDAALAIFIVLDGFKSLDFLLNAIDLITSTLITKSNICDRVLGNLSRVLYKLSPYSIQ